MPESPFENDQHCLSRRGVMRRKGRVSDLRRRCSSPLVEELLPVGLPAAEINFVGAEVAAAALRPTKISVSVSSARTGGSAER